MAIKIRLTRGGSKKRPFYKVVAADSRMPRDGRFIEKLGIYNPLLPKDHPERVKLNVEKIQEWLGKGAQVSDRISRLLENLSVLPSKSRNNPKKGLKHKATQERETAKSEKESTPVEPKKSDNLDEKITDQSTVNETPEEKNTVTEDTKNSLNEDQKSETVNSPQEKQEPATENPKDELQNTLEDTDKKPVLENTEGDEDSKEKKSDD